MEEIRIIRYSSENGSSEGVFFTEEFDLDAEDVIPHGCTLDSDRRIHVTDWETCFPMDYNLERWYKTLNYGN